MVIVPLGKLDKFKDYINALCLILEVILKCSA